MEALVLGLVQGLTEFLPISSSAHLSVVGELVGSEDPGAAFTAITQLGTETAVLVYFRRDIVRIARAWLLAVAGRGPRRDPDVRIGLARHHRHACPSSSWAWSSRAPSRVRCATCG